MTGVYGVGLLFEVIIRTFADLIIIKLKIYAKISLLPKGCSFMLCRWRIVPA